MSLTKNENILLTTIKVYFYLWLTFGICLAIVFLFASGNIFNSFLYGLASGIIFGSIMTLYIFIGLFFFQKRKFVYSSIPEKLRDYDLKNIYQESAAGNTTGLRVKYGGLFLTDEFILFIPHKFAIDKKRIKLPLNDIREVKKIGINITKHFSGGLRNRLFVTTVYGEHYEFSLWDIDSWIDKIKEMRQQPITPSRWNPEIT